MFGDATSFNRDLCGWDISGADSTDLCTSGDISCGIVFELLSGSLTVVILNINKSSISLYHHIMNIITIELHLSNFGKEILQLLFE